MSREAKQELLRRLQFLASKLEEQGQPSQIIQDAIRYIIDN